MPPYEVVAGDTGTILKVVIKNDQDKVVVNLTGCTVRLKYRIDGGSLVTKTMTVTDAAKGEAQYKFVASELTAAAAGKSTLRGEVEVMDGGGEVVTQLVPMNLLIRAKV